MNNEIILLFNRIYCEGNLTKMIASKSNIKKLDNFYKERFQLFSDFSLFLSDMGSLRHILELSCAAKAEYRKQFIKRQALQPSVLNKCFVMQTLANLFDLDKCVDISDTSPITWTKLLNAVKLASDKYFGRHHLSYIYFNSESEIVILQYGDSSFSDVVFVNRKVVIRLEIKDTKAKMGEYDLNYKEDGKLIATDKIKTELKDFLPYIERFNIETSIFERMGSNYNIGILLDKEFADRIITATYKTKKLDLFLLSYSNRIFTIPTTHLLDNSDISGSEIRIAGRNNYKVFTPINLKLELEKKGAKSYGSSISLLYNAENEKKGRGMSRITRYEINSIYFVRIEDIIIREGYVFFDLDKVRQKKPTLAMHIYTVLNRFKLANIYKELNS